ncbi:DNA-binding response regulator, OmpR family, contains REC and winged-helix (wHTH) domain [Paraburkholderia steynii]|uniref:DNA-binding response regulator, OmpR family, contains REC and winged-helix (WHTH) domain n=1 Tax=Paraburkholderia steynii TaxID=1245441 RepID=A0A7Z7BAY5_9BURK|nr:response regulator [Paraburkholderia steynii]SDI50125.1 DNA-binding response regulator, OmpR family, contains REC and winged-helix (wHTH) domain [Paraburkholderia steynii]
MLQKKIMVVEDDSDSASILDAYLRRDGFAVALSPDGRHAVQMFAQWKPDLVLLDVMLPGMSGTEVLSAIRRAGDAPVIMVTAIGDESDKVGALRYGADDYVVKPYNPREVVARVHAVLRRTGLLRPSGELLRYGRLAVNTLAVRASVEDESGAPHELTLTPAEFNLLATLLATPHKAFTRSELLEACLPGSDALERVVDVHVSNLRRKLEQHGILGVLVTVRAVGYRFQ